jgi:hypothetical protein
MKTACSDQRRMKVNSPILALVRSCITLALCSIPAFAQPPPALRPPRGEIGPTFWEQYEPLVIIAALAAFILAVVLTVLFMLPKHNPAESPLGATRRGLAARQNRTEDGALIMEVSQIFRGYVIFAFELPSGELTTAELAQSLQSLQKTDPALTTAIVDFFRRCDEDKFSPPALPPHANVASRALELLNKIEAQRRQTLMQQTTA